MEREISRLWNLKNVKAVPIVVRALGCMKKELGEWIDKLEIRYSCKYRYCTITKDYLIGNSKHSKKVLEQ